MADTLFTDATPTVPGTPLVASWHNDVNTIAYSTLSGVTGTNSIVATGPLTLSGYTNGLVLKFKPTANNTTAVTLNVNGLGVRNVVKYTSTPLVADDLISGSMAVVIYDATAGHFQLINPGTTEIAKLTGILPISKGGTGITTIIPTGQCRLDKVSNNIVLSPYNGNILAFPAGYATIPAAGVSLAPTGLTPGVNYYIYAVQTAGVVSSLEASTTIPATDASTGIRIKTSDATRVLVGYVSVATGPSFVDSITQRLVLSWYNQKRMPLNYTSTINGQTNSTTPDPINTFLRLEFLSWGDTGVSCSTSLGVSHNSAGGFLATGLALDSTSSFNLGAVPFQAYTATANGGCSFNASFLPSNGYHFLILLGSVASGTAVWGSNGRIDAMVQI